MDPYAWRNPGRSLGKCPYTAHADFMNGWTEDGAVYDGSVYESGLPIAALRFYAHSKAEENTSGKHDDSLMPASIPCTYRMTGQMADARSTRKTLTLVKFKIPSLPVIMDAFAIQIPYSPLAGKTETNGADQILYPISSDWHVSTVSRTINRRSTGRLMPCYIWTIHMSIVWLMSIKRCAKRWRKETEISRYIGGDRQEITTISRQRTKTEPALMLTGFKKTPSCNRTVPADTTAGTMAAQALAAIKT